MRHKIFLKRSNNFTCVKQCVLLAIRISLISRAVCERKGLWVFRLVEDPSMHPWKISEFSKNKRCEKGVNFRLFSTLEQCFSAFYDVASLKGQPFSMLPSHWETASVYSQNSEGWRQIGGVPPKSAARKLGDFPTSDSEGWCLRIQEHNMNHQLYTASTY